MSASPLGAIPSPDPSSSRQQVDYILGDSLFRDAFQRESKRAERSNTPFAVVLIDCGDSASEGEAWTPIIHAVSAVKREVDAVGWFEQGRVLGVLLHDADGKGASKVMQRLRRELTKRLDPSTLQSISIRLYANGNRTGLGDAKVFDVSLLVIELMGNGHPKRDAAKRALDIVGSIGLLMLFSPALLGAALAVKWTSPGPILFRQVRIGRRGEPFKMLKFRSMFANAGHGIHQDYVSWFIKSSSKQQKTGNEVFKLTNDPRITSVGRFLRRTSLDELPQFWNVLRGEMSLVGPRPPLPFEVEQYQPWHRRRVLDAKPGVTGLWQVKGRSSTTFDEMVRLDLRYARSRTLWMDIKILAATPRAMLTGKGAA